MKYFDYIQISLIKYGLDPNYAVHYFVSVIVTRTEEIRMEKSIKCLQRDKNKQLRQKIQNICIQTLLFEQM